MAKLTDVPVVTTLADTDLLYGVDVSDTTDDPAGSSVAITKANLLAGGGVLTNLGTLNNAAPANFDWDGIDLAQYDRLYIRGHVWDTTTVAGERSLWFNGDFTDANYRAQRGYSVNTASVAAVYTSSATISRIHGTDGKADGKTNIDITIEAPGLTGKLKAAINRSLNQDKTASQLVIDDWAMEHKTITGALTRLTFESCEGELTLFGEKYADASGGTATNLPVVQSARYDGDFGFPALGKIWENEPGWVITRIAAGDYDVTFPTAATSADAQAIAITVTSGRGGATLNGIASNVTATGCKVFLSFANASLYDGGFSIIRRLPDASATAIVATQPAGTVVKEEIQRVTNLTAGAINFSSIPAGYDRLYIQGTLETTRGAFSEQCSIRFNGDATATNYRRQHIQYQDGTPVIGTANTNDIGEVNAASAPAPTEVNYVCDGYANTKYHTVGGSQNSLVTGTSIVAGSMWVSAVGSTAPITSIEFYANVSASLSVFICDITLYGERTI